MSNSEQCTTAPFQPRFSRASAAFLCVSLWGCWAIYNATRNGYAGRNFAARQVLWLLLGGIALLLTAGTRSDLYRKLTPILAAAAYLPLLLVLLFGIRINGMRGWFAWHGYFLQPSELAKPIYVLSLAWLMQRTEPWRTQWLKGFLPVLAFVGVWTAPIALQPDHGTLLIYGLIFATMYWGLGGPARHLAVSALLGALGVTVAIVRRPYVLARFEAFIDPAAHAEHAGWHILQFRRTLAAGGLFGRAWENGLGSKAYLPLGYSDSVFASTAEKLGFLGVLPLIVLILALMIYGHYHACRTPDRFRKAVIFGLASMLVTQALVHLSVNLGLLPPTGITLPLISYGGSSLMGSMIAFGMLESMVHHVPVPDNPPAAVEASTPSADERTASASQRPCPVAHRSARRLSFACLSGIVTARLPWGPFHRDLNPNMRRGAGVDERGGLENR